MTVTIGRRELLAALGGAARWPLAASCVLLGTAENDVEFFAPSAPTEPRGWGTPRHRGQKGD
jgi:hypothetical protein